MPFRDFAPFKDINGDGIYNPQDGDYPDIKGDQSIWWMYNDMGNEHEVTGGEQLGVEVGVLAYAFNSTTPPSLDNTTFYEYTIVNRSTELISDYYIGIFADVDLGCWNDDYVGCDVSRQMGYVYNGDAEDEVDCTGNGYGTEIPMLGIQMLQTPTDLLGNPTPLSSFIVYKNDFGPTGNPTVTMDYYNYLTEAVKIMFPSNPQSNEPDAWSECSEGNPIGDRRFVMAVGPSELQPDDVKHLAFSVVWVPDVPHPCPDLAMLQNAADEIREVYEEQLVSVQSPVHPTASVSLIPNPMTSEAVLSIESKDKIRNIELYAANGLLLRTYNNVDNHTTQIIERGTLPTGVYFYTVNFDNGQMKSGKIIMQ